MRGCPICNDSNKELIKHIDMIQYEDDLLNPSFDVVFCKNCGMVYHDVEPSNFDKFYSYYTGKPAKYFVQENEKVLNENTACFISESCDKNQSVLDIGCSHGVLIKLLADRGFTDITGVDLDQNAIAYVNECGFTGMVGSVLDLSILGDKKFDIIILRHVLEHIYDLHSALDEVEKHLESDGKIVIEVPSTEFYFESAPFPGYFIESQHINHFALVDLKNLMRGFSLKAHESKGHIYPCTRAVFSRDCNGETSLENQRPILNDTQNRYVHKMISQPNSQGDRLLSVLDAIENERLCIWGCGTHVFRLLTHTKLGKLNIQLIVDRNPAIQGKKILGQTIMSPEEINNFDGSILISGLTSKKSILDDISKRGIPNKVVCLS